jgi:hypothetical protein
VSIFILRDLLIFVGRLLLAFPLSLLWFLVVALVGSGLDLLPPEGVDRTTMPLIVVGQFVGGTLWGMATKP